YAISIAVVAAAIVLRLLLDPLLGDRLPFLTLLPAVALVAWLCGRSPALLAIPLCLAAFAFLLLEPRDSFTIDRVEYRIGLVAHGLLGLGLVGLVEAMR